MAAFFTFQQKDKFFTVI